jgi:predicted 3-demethylubiquinone-9 3-methyltransferase (glyoxalase superfamily)
MRDEFAGFAGSRWATAVLGASLEVISGRRSVVMDAVTTCLWFDTEAEEAARFYTAIFPNSSVGKVTPYPTGDRAGQTMTVGFVLNGSKFVALNGGPDFTFNESVSFMVPCEDQAEVDRYWTALTADGGEESMCGWLKDRFGVSWQVVPTQFEELLSRVSPAQAERVTQALYQMRKIVIAELEAAAAP